MLAIHILNENGSLSIILFLFMAHLNSLQSYPVKKKSSINEFDRY